MRDSPHCYVTPTVQIHEVTPVWKLRVQALSRRDVKLPGEPNSCVGNDPYLLWRAPGDWLAYSTKHPIDSLKEWLGNFPYPAPLVLTDISAGLVVIEMSGSEAIEVLLRDCPLDLEGTAVPPGACAQTYFAHTTVLFHRPEESTWRLFVERSVAQHVWEWLVDTAELLEASA